jgi:hypothetical protein
MLWLGLLITMNGMIVSPAQAINWQKVKSYSINTLATIGGITAIAALAYGASTFFRGSSSPLIAQPMTQADILKMATETGSIRIEWNGLPTVIYPTTTKICGNLVLSTEYIYRLKFI